MAYKYAFRWLAAAFLLTAASHVDATLFMIDPFTDDQLLDILSGPGVRESDLAPGSFIGNNRKMRLQNESGNSTVAANSINPGALIVANSSTANATVTLTWTGITGSDQDFTGGGSFDGLFLGIPISIDKDLEVAFSANGISDLAMSFADGTFGSAFFFPFADFSDPSVFTAVTDLTMELSSPDNAWDANIVFLAATPAPQIPVPGTLPLLAFGIALWIGSGLAPPGLRHRRRV